MDSICALFPDSCSLNPNPVVVKRARVCKKNTDREGEGKKEGREGICAATGVWPVDYGAETSARVSLQPVSDSVFARGYKEKDGEQADSRGKKHAYAMEKARAGGERPRSRGREGCCSLRAMEEDGE